MLHKMQSRYSSINVDRIKNEGLCTGCGTCVSMCPYNAIEMNRSIDGVYLPNVDYEKCNRQCKGFCVKVCPSYSLDLNKLNKFVFGKIPEDVSLGSYNSCYIGHSSSKELRWNSSSGGIVTSLLIFALEEGIIDGALVTRMKEYNPLEPEVILARTKNQIISASKSKYCPVPVNVALKKILKENGRFAIVGLPCHIQGVRKAEMLNKELKEKIVLHIGLFCTHNVSFLATELLLEKMGIRKENVAAISYRGKGWPGETSVRLKSGREISVKPYTKYWDCVLGNFLFTPIRCTLCADMLTELSDISCGDAWLPELKGDKIGTSIIIARTKTGEELLHSAKSKGKIEIANINAKKVEQSQFFSLKFKKKALAAHIFLLKLFGKSAPYINPKPSPSGFASYLIAAIVYLNIYMSSKERTRVLLRYIPFPLLRLFFRSCLMVLTIV